VEKYSILKNAKIKNPPKGTIHALLVPHAAHVCSGQIAAYAYKLVQGKDFQTVILLGPSHRYGFEGCSIYLKGGYQTPLGTVAVDTDLAAALSRASGYKYIPQAHMQEHSLEVQIPFIQKVLPQAKIVPVVMGFQRKKTILTLSKALSKVVAGRKVLVIASTDMSHYQSQKRAYEIDSNTIALIQSLKTETLIWKIERQEQIMCGGGPAVAALLYAKEKEKAKALVLKYGDSTICGSSPSRVVGYMSAVLYSESNPGKFSLSREEKQELLHLARLAVEKFIQEKKILEYTPRSSTLLEKRGAFVTLKKRGELRGCIGFVEPVAPLYQTVISAALYAACRDARFPPVSSDELEELSIEISVLSPLEKIKNPRLVEVGRHGLLIAKDGKRGLLLPQVPEEYHWSREQFLEQTCQKAGLPKNAWKKGADIYVFEAIVFH